MAVEIQVYGYRDMVIEPREMKALYNALNDKLTDSIKTPGHLLTLDLPTLRERLIASENNIIRISTGAYWGFWKCVTRKEIVWDLTRLQAIKLRAVLERALAKRKRSRITVSKRFLEIVPIS